MVELKGGKWFVNGKLFALLNKEEKKELNDFFKSIKSEYRKRKKYDRRNSKNS